MDASSRPDLQVLIAPHMQSPADERARHAHAKMLVEEGYLTESAQGGVFRLTIRGAEFLDTIGPADQWKRVKEVAGDAGAASLGFLGKIGWAVVKAEVKKRSGLDL